MKKRKVAEERTAKQEHLIDEPVSAASEHASANRCTVCGGEVAPFSNESLCWVCRRLKISAWRDSENQIGMQE